MTSSAIISSSSSPYDPHNPSPSSSSSSYLSHLNSSSSSESLPPHSSSHLTSTFLTSSSLYSSALRIKTLCHKEISFKISSNSGGTLYDLKVFLTSNSPLSPHDLLLISHGKHLSDDSLPLSSLLSSVTTDHKPLYAFLKPSVTTVIPVHIKLHGRGEIFLNCPMNMKVIDLKKKIYATKECNLSPLEQRAICSTRLMKDHNLLGDYLLGAPHTPAAAGAGGGSSSSSSSSSSKGLTIYLSQTMNLKRDLTVHLTLPNQRQVSFPFQFDDTLYFIRDILQKQFGLPLPTAHSSSTSSSNSGSSEDVTVADLGLYFQSDRKTRLSLDRSLYDYGVYPPTKSVKLVMRNHSSSPPPSPFPLISVGHGNAEEATAAAATAAVMAMPQAQGMLEELIGQELGGKRAVVSVKDGCIVVTFEADDESTTSPSASSTKPSSTSAQKPSKSSSSSASSAAAASGPASASAPPQKKSSSRSSDGLFSGMKRGFLSAGNTRSCKMKTSSSSSASSSSSSSTKGTRDERGKKEEKK
jgi:hypothetical protein